MSKPFPTIPLAIGAVAGATIISILGFTNGWIISANASEAQVLDAGINAQAAVCASLVQGHIKTENITDNLEGYQEGARTARDMLARKFAVVLPGESEVDTQVITACAQMLNKPPA